MRPGHRPHAATYFTACTIAAPSCKAEGRALAQPNLIRFNLTQPLQNARNLAQPLQNARNLAQPLQNAANLAQLQNAEGARSHEVNHCLQAGQLPAAVLPGTVPICIPCVLPPHRPVTIAL